MAETKIEWTDVTWNPVTGCDRVSPGCDNCYAATMAKRLKAMGQPRYQRDGDQRTSGPGFGVTVHPDVLHLPLSWRKPRRVFVNSMSDLFHRDVPEEFIARVFAVMATTRRHTYQVLTKRPQRMAALLAHPDFRAMVGSEILALPRATTADREAGWVWPLRNVWLGTSIENDQYTFRADHLRRTPAAVRFISAEPLLGPLPSLDLTGIDWLIVGGESGPGARPMHPDWVRRLRDRCLKWACPSCLSRRVATFREAHHGGGYRVACHDCGHEWDGKKWSADPDNRKAPAFFFKQWGEWEPWEEDDQPFWRSVSTGELLDGHHLPSEIIDGDPVAGWWAPLDGEDSCVTYLRAGKKAAGRGLDGRTWDEMP